MYPIISRADLREILAMHIAGDEVTVADFTTWIGEGEKLDTTALSDLGVKLTAGTQRSDPPDKIEGSLCHIVHETLRPHAPEILDDPDFWSYVSFAHCLSFVTWRESKAIASYKDPGKKAFGKIDNVAKYFHARAYAECVLHRMFLRGRLLSETDRRDLSDEIAKATDFWRSHVLRVSTSFNPILTSVMAQRQADDRLKTKRLREAARYLNRSNTNVFIELLDHEESMAAVDQAWEWNDEV